METFSALRVICAGNHRSPVNSLHKGQWRGALMFFLICVWINGWVNNREADDLRRYRAHYDVIVMFGGHDYLEPHIATAALPRPMFRKILSNALQWRHNEHDCVSNHQPHDCLLKRLIRRRSKKTSKLRVTGLCEGNSPGSTGEFPAQRASNVENVSIWWRHHDPWCNIWGSMYSAAPFILWWLWEYVYLILSS